MIFVTETLHKHNLKVQFLPPPYRHIVIGPPMIRVNRKRLSIKMILGPSVFTFLSVRQSVCLSVRLSVQALHATVLITEFGQPHI